MAIDTTNMMVLDFTVTNQTISFNERRQVVADSVNFLYAKFTFSEEWDIADSKVAVFYKTDTGGRPLHPAYEVTLAGDGCTFPSAVIKPPVMWVSVYCMNAAKQKLITANMQPVSVIPSGFGENSILPLPPDLSGVNTAVGSTTVQLVRDNAGVFEYSTDSGATWKPIQARSIAPVDITAQAVDANTLTGASSSDGNKHSWICKTAGGAATKINTPVANAPFFLDWIPCYVSATTFSGMQIFTTVSGDGTIRRVYYRWLNYTNSIAAWTLWTLDGTVSTGVTTLTIEGTASFINAELAKLPLTPCNNVTCNIQDGDYSTETITIPTNFSCVGSFTVQAKTAVAAKTQKAVKLKNIVFNGQKINNITLQYIEFTGGTAEHCVNINYFSGSISIQYCDFGLNRAAILDNSYFAILVNRFFTPGNIRVAACRINYFKYGFQFQVSTNSVIDTCDFSDCTYSIYTESIVGLFGANTFTNCSYQVYRTTGGVLNNQVQQYNKWSSGAFTGTHYEHVFAKITAVGVYTFTFKGSGNAGISVGSIDIVTGYGSSLLAESSPLFVFTPGGAKLKLSYSNISSSVFVFRVESDNPMIGAATNTIDVTITPKNAVDSDSYVVLDPPDSPTSWTYIYQAT